ncbi:hypothetical protein B0J15DRAFT_458384 [Fusarium solani]|uniref:Prion-inhibition and propagation HeLo domain-containing protein n=1 Tax=Fusarium solani TaxID=169388 RepID=A0A9P9L950_FUSSL|nr:uncharacterized protein B0J15DRAFT_458384 [Fusarium solani]KAH7276266.1 hypothetical protein B0J15DRAFT_458384 [Fusarium solani]
MPSDSQTAKPETQGKFITSAALKRFWTLKSSPGSRISAKAASGSTTHRVLAKTQWAIQDKDKFAALVNHVRDLVTGLYDVLPIPLGHEDKLVTEDIRSLLPDTRRLRQVEIASKDVYPAWSEAASVVASISEMGSIALGTQQGEVGPAGTESLVEVASNAMQIPQDELDQMCTALLSSGPQNRYFVFTAECISGGFGVPCDTSPARTIFIDSTSPSFASTHSNVNWSIGKRVTSSISPKFDWEALEILKIQNYECDSLQRAAVEATLPSETVSVYCAACACAIRTALLMCKSESSQLIQYRTRVDDRMPAACCPKEYSKARLESLLETIQLWEVGLLKTENSTSLLRYLDRVWIEKRLYQIDTNHMTMVDREPVIQAASLISSIAEKNAVFIGELDDLRVATVHLTPPLPTLPRQPRLNEIYQMKKRSSLDHWQFDFLGSFTPFTMRISSI